MAPTITRTVEVDHRGAVNLTGVSSFKKGEQPHKGEGMGAWSGLPDRSLMFKLGLGSEAILGFDTSTLTLDDFESMRFHPQVNASLTALTFMIHQADWHVECDDKRIKEMVEENLRAIWTRLIRSMGSALWAGYSPAILEFENDAQGRYTIINKVKDLHPAEAKVKWKKHDGVIAGRQRSWYTFDGIDQIGWGHIPALNSFWYPLLMEQGDMSGRKLLRAAFMPWYFSLVIHIYTNRYFERFGEPLPIGRAPFEETIVEPDGKSWTGKQLMETMLINLRNRGAVVLPSDRDSSTGTGAQAYTWDIDYLESQMRGVDFERYLTRLDEEISLALFTPLLLMRNADVGSHNLGVQHVQTWMWFLNALLGDMKEYVDRYICERLKAINFSEKAPRCEWVPKKLGKENVETVRAIATELLRQGIAKPDLEQMGTALGMDLTEIRQVQPTNPNAPQEDDRDRTERDRSTDGPGGVGSSPTPGSRTGTLAARISQNLWGTWSSGTVQISPLTATEIMHWGQKATNVQSALETLNGMDTGDFESPGDVVMIAAKVIGAIEAA